MTPPTLNLSLERGSTVYTIISPIILFPRIVSLSGDSCDNYCIEVAKESSSEDCRWVKEFCKSEILLQLSFLGTAV